MKRKILSLILVLMLLPLASLFSACGKNDGYNLNALDEDYREIAEENNNIILNADGSFSFDYQDKDLKRIINETAPYNQLLKYNDVLYNLMAFANEYIDECANNSGTSNVQIKNQVQEDLKELKHSINDVNENINMLAEMIVKESDANAGACLSRFETVLYTYESVFQNAISFSTSLSDLYFNYILNEGNPNVYSNGFENFDSAVVVNKLRSRVYFQKSNLSQCFVEMYIYENLAHEVAFSLTTFDLNKYSYLANVNLINKSFEEATAIQVANNPANKEKFYDLAVRAQNLQATLRNDQSKFVKACNDIEYSYVKDSADATAHQLMCAQIIEANNSLVSTYNSVLAEMLTIVTSAS